jgi:hypothetical protein
MSNLLCPDIEPSAEATRFLHELIERDAKEHFFEYGTQYVNHEGQTEIALWGLGGTSFEPFDSTFPQQLQTR